ncbi:MAG: hypothetical protein ABEJ64_02865 [Candidatus Nanohaloarchaea archaeon]
MSYGKLAKGMTAAEARRKLQEVMPSQKRRKDFQGASPPSVFIGSSNYPKVNTGILSPQHPGSTELLDSPDDWYREDYGIEKIAQMRTSLVNSKQRLNVQDSDRFLDNTREVAMARKPVDIEVSLEKAPANSVSGGRVKPVSASGNVEEFVLGENPSVERRLEDAFYDTDWKAQSAVRKLYSKGVDNYRLQQALSAGMLGEVENRKLVPTRWSITASDDMISQKLREKVKQYQEIGRIEYYRNSYLGNHFHIFLVPGRWEHELIELKRPGSTWNAAQNTHIGVDHEPYAGRTQYAEETSGAYYASRLGVLEHLQSRRRQAKALVVREVTPEYWAPLGVWIIRETVRNAFEDAGTGGVDCGGEELESFKEVQWRISREFRFLYDRIRRKSNMIDGRQASLADF